MLLLGGNVLLELRHEPKDVSYSSYQHKQDRNFVSPHGLVRVYPYDMLEMSSVPATVLQIATSGEIPGGLKSCQPLIQLRPAAPPRHIAHGYRDGFLLADQHDQPLASGHAGVEQVPLQHDVVLRQYGDDHGGILRSLALVDRRRIGQHQRVEFAKPVGDRATVEAGSQLAGFEIDPIDVADIAVI